MQLSGTERAQSGVLMGNLVGSGWRLKEPSTVEECDSTWGSDSESEDSGISESTSPAESERAAGHTETQVTANGYGTVSNHGDEGLALRVSITDSSVFECRLKYISIKATGNCNTV